MLGEAANKLLMALSVPVRKMVLSRCTAVGLPRRTVLYQPQAIPDYCYFLVTGMASVSTVMRDGESAEVSVLGAEGLAGGVHLLGPGKVPTTCIMQLGGRGLRIPMPEMGRLYSSVQELRQRVLESVQEQTHMVSQIAACNRLHEAEQRLARWLLTASDRTGDASLNFTHEAMAELLGARRTTVTMVAGTLQRSGLIEYKRGWIKILDRDRLKEAACECFQITSDLHQQLYKQVSN